MDMPTPEKKKILSLSSEVVILRECFALSSFIQQTGQLTKSL